MTDKPILCYGLFVLTGGLISMFTHSATNLEVGMLVGVAISMITYGVANDK